jgi:hypothetical protein
MHIPVPSLTNILNYYTNQFHKSVTDVVNWKNAEALKNAALARPEIALPVLATGAVVSLYALSRCFSSTPTTEQTVDAEETASESKIHSYSATMTVEFEETNREQPASEKSTALVTVATPKPEDDIVEVNATELAEKQSEKPTKRIWTVFYIGNQPVLAVSDKVADEVIREFEKAALLWLATPHFCPNCMGFSHPVFAFPSLLLS